MKLNVHLTIELDEQVVQDLLDSGDTHVVIRELVENHLIAAIGNKHTIHWPLIENVTVESIEEKHES